MRILIDYRPALRSRTGAGEYIHQLTRALARSVEGSDELTVFSSSWKDRLRGNVEAELPGARIADRRVPVKVLNFAWHRLGWPPVEEITGGKYDVVHSPHPLLIPARRAAQVVTIHDLDFLTHPERTRAEIRRDYPALVKSHATGADQVIVSSRYTAAQVERMLEVRPERVTVCPAGAPDWPEQGDSSEGSGTDRYILFLGSLEPRKNIGGLLDAYRLLIERRQDAPKLVLAGRVTDEVAPWLEALKRPPLAGRAEHIGYVRDEARRALYKRAQMLVLLSFEEGFGLPVLEAMSLGVPVVASDRGAIPEVLGDAGLLVDPAETEAVAAAMERMLSDEALAGASAAKGLLRAKQFSWKASAKILRKAYDEAVAIRRERNE